MLVIGIAGGSGSGKTTVAQAVLNKLGPANAGLISQDSYYKDAAHLPWEERIKINYDHPDSFDNELLLAHLEQLKNGQAIQMPTYDFSRHTRAERTVQLTAAPVLVLEGILVLADPLLRDQMDIKIFVDTEADVRVLRRVTRDIQERGRSIESVYEQYLKTVKPMHDAFIEPSKRYADLIVPEGGHNEIAINMLISTLEKYLDKAKTDTL